MKLIIAGSRTVSPTIDDIDAAFDDLVIVRMDVREVICGDAAGADTAGARWAQARGVLIHHEPVTQADYETHGRYLGPKMRNRRMAERGDGLIAFWDGTSRGTADMVTRMVARGKPVRVVPMKAAARSRRSAP